jgi:hypothetical protein
MSAYTIVTTDADEFRAILRRVQVGFVERQHWWFWIRFELVGSPRSVDAARAAVKAWQDARWWGEQW